MNGHDHYHDHDHERDRDCDRDHDHDHCQDLRGGGYNLQHASYDQGKMPNDAFQLSNGLAILPSHIWIM